MIEDFEVVNTKKEGNWIDYNYKFTLNNEIYYSVYSISINQINLFIYRYYYKEAGFISKVIPYSEETEKEITKIILQRKENRLRHLLRPYIIY